MQPISFAMLICLVVSCLQLTTAYINFNSVSTPRISSISRLYMGYVPEGLTPEQYKKIKEEEKAKLKNLGRVGPRGFKSRSFQAWQEAGGKHLFPVDPKKVKSGEIPLEDVPYMQRGGSWDNSDLKGNKNYKPKDAKSLEVKRLKLDDEYEAGGFRKEQSVSIFGGAPLPWTQKYQAMDWEVATGRKKQVGPRTKIEGGVSKDKLEEMRKQIKEENQKTVFGKISSIFGKK